MPAKRRPPFELEPGEGKAHEASESPEDETREGAEDAAPTSRKRSARGASRTKAPMDAEGGCCNAKKGKAKCSACAAGKPCGGAKVDTAISSRVSTAPCGHSGEAPCRASARGDALTPWEYLDAAELGIQNRSRAYIRARLDAEQRLDAGVKCGGGYIAQGKKCKAGAGGAATPSRPGRTGGKGLRSTEGGGGAPAPKKQRVRGALENTAMAAGAVGNLVSAVQTVRAAGKGDFTAMSKGLQRQAAFNAVYGAGALSKGKRTGNQQLVSGGKANIAIAGINTALAHTIGGGYTAGALKNAPTLSGAKAGLSRAAAAGKRAARNTGGRLSALRGNISQRRSRARLERSFKKDSTWASGFSTDSATWAL
jgi:hypothetical protein